MYSEKVEEDFLKKLKEEQNNSVFLMRRNCRAYKTYQNLCTNYPNSLSCAPEFIEFPEMVLNYKDTLYDFQNDMRALSSEETQIAEGYIIYSVLFMEKIKEVTPEDSLDVVQMLSKIVQDHPEHFV